MKNPQAKPKRKQVSPLVAVIIIAVVVIAAVIFFVRGLGPSGPVSKEEIQTRIRPDIGPPPGVTLTPEQEAAMKANQQKYAKARERTRRDLEKKGFKELETRGQGRSK